MRDYETIPQERRVPQSGVGKGFVGSRIRRRERRVVRSGFNRGPHGLSGCSLRIPWKGHESRRIAGYASQRRKRQKLRSATRLPFYRLSAGMPLYEVCCKFANARARVIAGCQF